MMTGETIWTNRAVWLARKMVQHGRANDYIAARLGAPFTAAIVQAKRTELGRKTAPKSADAASLKARRAAAGSFANAHPGGKASAVAPIKERKHDGPVYPPADIVDDRSRCHFPIGDLKSDPAGFGYCGAAVPKDSKRPYCELHLRTTSGGTGNDER